MGKIGLNFYSLVCTVFDVESVRFSDIFWIDASSEHTVDLCLRQIAKKHKVDSTLQLKLLWSGFLVEMAGLWCLIMQMGDIMWLKCSFPLEMEGIY
jgi:hypothetical protein